MSESGAIATEFLPTIPANAIVSENSTKGEFHDDEKVYITVFDG